jgi:hypothetical protein
MTDTPPAKSPIVPVLLLACIMLVAAVGYYLVQPGAEKIEKETALSKLEIERVLRAQAEAWNRGDLEGFMTGYARLDRLTYISGKDQLKGWQALFDRYRKNYLGEGKAMGALTFSEVEIKLQSPSWALVTGRWQVVTAADTKQGFFTLVFEKLPEGMRITYDHTSGG